MGKTVAVLTTDDDSSEGHDVLGAYSTLESARIQAQIHANAYAEAYGMKRIELAWITTDDKTYTWSSLAGNLDYFIDVVTLDDDVRQA